MTINWMIVLFQHNYIFYIFILIHTFWTCWNEDCLLLLFHWRYQRPTDVDHFEHGNIANVSRDSWLYMFFLFQILFSKIYLHEFSIVFLSIVEYFLMIRFSNYQLGFGVPRRVRRVQLWKSAQSAADFLGSRPWAHFGGRGQGMGQPVPSSHRYGINMKGDAGRGLVSANILFRCFSSFLKVKYDRWC